MGRSAERHPYEPSKADTRLYEGVKRGRPVNLTVEEMREVEEYVKKHLRSPSSFPILRFCRDHNIRRGVLNGVKTRLLEYKPAFSQAPIENPRTPWSWHNDQPPTPDHQEACKKWKTKVIQHREDVHPDAPDPAKPPPETTGLTPEKALKRIGELADSGNLTGEEMLEIEALQKFIHSSQKVGGGAELGPPLPQTRGQKLKRLERLLDCVGPELWMEAFNRMRGPKFQGAGHGQPEQAAGEGGGSQPD